MSKTNYDQNILTAIAEDKTNKLLRQAVTGLVDRQTTDEVAVKRTIAKNGNGLYPRDARYMTEVADYIRRNRRLPAGAREKILARTLRYRRQVTEILTPELNLN